MYFNKAKKTAYKQTIAGIFKKKNSFKTDEKFISVKLLENFVFGKVCLKSDAVQIRLNFCSYL